MNDEQLPPTTAPGFSGLPIAPESAGPSAPLRGAWSLRRRAAMAVAALALVGTGGAVAGSLGSSNPGADQVTPAPGRTATHPASQPAAPSHERDSNQHESDEA